MRLEWESTAQVEQFGNTAFRKEKNRYRTLSTAPGGITVSPLGSALTPKAETAYRGLGARGRHMLYSNAIQMLGCICLFLACGLGIVAPLARQIAFPAAASVFAGALALSSAALTLHVATQIKFSHAVWIAAAGLISLSATTLSAGARQARAGRDLAATAATLVFLVGASCLVYLGRENQFSSPALIYFSGTDQFGYAQLADWLNGAPGNMGMAATPESPWDSWVHYMVTLDPRFGSISLVAIVSALTGRSGMFSYNLSCALVMVAAAVGLAGVFARSLMTFIIVAAGVFLSSWFTVSMAGYFGRTIGFPATLFGVGMFFALARRSLDRDLAPAELLSVLTVVVSACIAFSAIGTVVTLLLAGGMRVAGLAIFEMPRRADLWPRRIGGVALALLVLALVGIISGGTVARPRYPSRHPLDDTSWMDLWLRASQVVGPDANLSIVPPQYQLALALLVGALLLAITLIAARSRSLDALAMISGFAILALMLVIAGKRWEFQLSLTVYVPAILCAVGAMSTNGNAIERHIAAVLALVIIAVGVGRFAATVKATTGAGANQRLRLSEAEMERIVTATTSTGGVYIDTPDVYSTYPLVLELHRRGIAFQFSPRAWKSFLGYRPWEAPQYSQLHGATVTLREAGAPACQPEALACTDHYLVEKTAAR